MKFKDIHLGNYTGYSTEMLQQMINEGYIVKPIYISGGWCEFDTAKDYEVNLEIFKHLKNSS